MTAPAVTYTFTNNTIADGSQVSTNFADLVTYVSNRNDGSSTWDVVKTTSSSVVPLVANNSTGTQNIVDFQDNGSIVFSVVDGGYVRGVAGAAATPTFSFIGDTNSGVHSGGADVVTTTAGGTDVTEVTTTTLRPAANNTFSLGAAGRLWTEVFATAGTINTSSLSEKTDVADIKKSEISVPRGIRFKYKPEYGRISERLVLGFSADDLPIDAHPKNEDGSYDMKNIYVNSVIGMLCAGYHDLKGKVDAIEGKNA